MTWLHDIERAEFLDAEREGVPVDPERPERDDLLDDRRRCPSPHSIPLVMDDDMLRLSGVDPAISEDEPPF